MQATAVGTAHAVIVWWQLNLDSSELITLDTAPCWVAKQPLVTAPQSSQVPQTGPLPQSGPQLVPAPGAEPLHAKEQTSHASHQSQLVGPTQSSSQAGSSGLSCSMQSPLAETAPAATAAAAAASFASVALPEDCLGHGQACRPEPGQWQQSQQPQQHQQQQQWRDHWKQCWTPVQAPFGLGKLWRTRSLFSVMSSGSTYSSRSRRCAVWHLPTLIDGCNLEFLLCFAIF